MMQTLVVIKKETILVLESWLAFAMILVSAAFLAFDIAEHGIRFKGSLVPLFVGTLMSALLTRARKREKFYTAIRRAPEHDRANPDGRLLPSCAHAEEGDRQRKPGEAAIQ